MMRIIAVAILAALILLAINMSGHSQKEDSDLTEIIEDNDLIDMLKILPQGNILVVCMDIATLESNPDLMDLYNYLHRAMFLPSVYFSGLSASAMVYQFPEVPGSTMTSGIAVFKGEFDLEYAIGILSEQTPTKGEYEGVTTWNWLYESSSLAYLNKIIVVGDTEAVEDSIRVSKNEEPSAYDDRDIRSVLDRLPDGVISMICKGVPAIATLTRETTLSYMPSLVYGFSIRQTTPEAPKITACFKFKNSPYAINAIDDIKAFVEKMWDTTQIEGQLKGNFVVITGEIDTSRR